MKRSYPTLRWEPDPPEPVLSAAQKRKLEWQDVILKLIYLIGEDGFKYATPASVEALKAILQHSEIDVRRLEEVPELWKGLAPDTLPGILGVAP